MSDLRQDLHHLDGRPFPAYKDLRRGRYSTGRYGLMFDHVQGDPFASPSRISVEVPAEVPVLASTCLDNAHARRATADFLHRRLRGALGESRAHVESGKSGLLEIAELGQEVLERTAVCVRPGRHVRRPRPRSTFRDRRGAEPPARPSPALNPKSTADPTWAKHRLQVLCVRGDPFIPAMVKAGAQQARLSGQQ
jgi:hypothetical protein